jgi:ATP-dependent RNA helicase DDX24/MAK5
VKQDIALTTMPKEKQTKRRRKQTTTIHKKNDIAWKPVDVTLVDEGEEDPLDDLNNHYDDPKLQRKAIKELQAEPGEDVAMFYGLEVLDANEYQVVGTGSDRHVIVKKSDIAAAAAAEEKNIEKTSSKKKDKKKGDSVKSKLDEDDADDSDNKKGRSEKREKEKKSKKKKRKREDDDDKNKPTGNMDADGKEEAFNPSQEDIMTIQTKWSSATGGVVLEERLCRSLVKLGYNEPTPIQAATLSASVLGRRNLVGAAPTGSGKTLAFLLPILQYLVELDATKKVDDDNRRVEALILTPTRELAQQICTESERMLPKECVSLTGGIAIVKQIRLLQSKPRIIVATPGRLWAMVRYPTLSTRFYKKKDRSMKMNFREITESNE